MLSDLNKIVQNGYCIGCGACCMVPKSGLRMEFDIFGQYKPTGASLERLPDVVNQEALQICPFSDSGPNEDELAKTLFGKSSDYSDGLGYHVGLYIGYVKVGDFRRIATSGGVTTWLLSRLLETNEIDGVIHVKPTTRPNDGVLFRYGISKTIDEVRAGAKSRYYPIEISEVISLVRQYPARYAFVGVPCFVKAIRRLAHVDAHLNASIKYTFGLVCGHLKSKAFADCFAWQEGIPPGELEKIDFRVKQPTGDAGNYAVYLKGDGKESIRNTRSFFGSNWGHNFFRNSACDYCDDVFAEAADISVGDAWLPDFQKDPHGNSVVVIRSQALHQMVRDGMQANELALVESDAGKITASQAGGFRDRREALGYRLWLDIQAGRSVPRKRVVPSRGEFPLYRRLVYRNRIRLRKISHIAWLRAVARGRFMYFHWAMRPWILLNDFYFTFPRAAGMITRLVSRTTARLAARSSVSKLS